MQHESYLGALFNGFKHIYIYVRYMEIQNVGVTELRADMFDKNKHKRIKYLIYHYFHPVNLH